MIGLQFWCYSWLVDGTILVVQSLVSSVKSTPNQQHAHTKCSHIVPMTYMDPTEGAGSQRAGKKATGVLFHGVLGWGLHTVSSTTKMNRGPQPCPQDSTSSQIVVYTRIEAKLHTEGGTSWVQGRQNGCSMSFGPFGSTMQSFSKSVKGMPSRCPKPMNCLYVVPGVYRNTAISA